MAEQAGVGCLQSEQITKLAETAAFYNMIDVFTWNLLEKEKGGENASLVLKK